MNALYPYLLETSISLGILTIGFLILLRKAPYFQLNRYLILGAIGLSLLLPVIPTNLIPKAPIPNVSQATSALSETFEFQESEENEPVLSNIQQDKEIDSPIDEKVTETLVVFDYGSMLLVLYLIGVLIMFITFCIQLSSTFQLTRKAKKNTWEGKPVYITSGDLPNFSFFNKIYLNQQWKNSADSEKCMIYQHELEHVKQKHTWDILLIELLKIFYWFNPAVWMLKRLLQLQHEYQVDANIQKSYGQKQYAELLLSIAMKPPKALAATNSISTFLNLKNRFDMMTQRRKLQSTWKYLLFILLFAISCTLEDEVTIVNYSDDLKFIESVYISHQSDTKDKNNKTVAIAYFNPDGSLQKAMQHMTYPYTVMEEKVIGFWSKPNKNNLTFVMDGFTLGQAEKNFLYGNDWPKTYVSFIEKIGNIKYFDRRAESKQFKPMITYESELPTQITYTGNAIFSIEGNDGFFLTNEENFKYDNGKVVQFSKDANAESYINLFHKDANEKEKQEIRKSFQNKKTFRGTHFSYEGENLTEVDQGRHSYKFYYEEDKLVKSEFYISDEKYHHREYFYKEDGSRDKTVIYNSMNELEYTIQYNYGYYEAE